MLNFSPSSPSVVFLGALLVEVLNRALPKPPFPPFAKTIDWVFSIKSAISSFVSSSIIRVPTGTFKIVFSASLPCLFLPKPWLPFLALYFFWSLKSWRVVSDSSVSMIMSPPEPPSPPSGPPLGINFSLLKLKHPLPPVSYTHLTLPTT